jgi:GNAT superfamily N-acetyltransferase
MYRELGRGRLSTGETLEVGIVHPCGEVRWRSRLEALLGHKSAINRRHIAATFAGPLDDLETLYYVGSVGGEPVTVAMLAGAHGAAIYGHVFTRPEWRRRGASTVLHRMLTQDWRRRGVRVVTLSTDPQGHARRLYEAVGFRPLGPGEGDMRWVNGGTLALDSGPRRVSPIRWGDWGWISEALSAEGADDEERPRSTLFRAPTPRYVDWPFLVLMLDTLDGVRPAPAVQVLRQGERAVGWAALLPDAARGFGAVALEFYLHPQVRTPEAADALLTAIAWPATTPVLHACSTPAGYRAEALPRHGFVPLAELPAWWDLGRGREGAIVWARAPAGAGA